MNEPKPKSTGPRFYVVSDRGDGSRCLVEANTASSALARAAAYYCDVRPASARDVMDLMRSGSDIIEVARGENRELPLPDPGETAGNDQNVTAPGAVLEHTAEIAIEEAEAISLHDGVEA